MAVSRRFGSRESATYNAILDAAERVLRKKGYPAASSRNIAEEAGIKQSLVYYYFKTMDDLLLSTFKRRTSQALERLNEQTNSPRPVRAIWEDLSQNVDARIVFEFVALANHHQGIRKEVQHFVRDCRRLQTEAIQTAVKANSIDIAPASASALAFILYATTLILARESSTGITEAHDDVTELLQTLIDQLD